MLAPDYIIWKWDEYEITQTQREYILKMYSYSRKLEAVKYIKKDLKIGLKDAKRIVDNIDEFEFHKNRA